MSSSSSAPDRPGGRLLRRALDALEREAPWHARALAAALADLDVRLAIDGEALALGADGGRVSLGAAAAPPGAGAVRAAVGLAAGLDLIEGRATVLGALRSGALAVRGPAGALLAAGRAADVFLHGMVRCASSRELLRDLRSAIEPETGGD